MLHSQIIQLVILLIKLIKINLLKYFTYNTLGGFFMNFSDNFFNRIEKKTKVGKQTILDLAEKLQKNDLKDEATLREVIEELGKLTGKEVSKEKQDKIINAVVNDKVPKDLDKFI